MSDPAPPGARLVARQVAEQVARSAYGRLLAYLAYRWRDIAAAEDALADAFTAALQTWPDRGVPDAPEAWLMTAARHKLEQMHRHAKVVADPAVTILLPQSDAAHSDPALFPDDRLKLLFVCAHPAIDPAMRTALMLQTVLGLDAQRIASAFLVSPAAMAQRLVRAKARIAQAGVRFEEPEAQDLPGRIHAVLEAIYAAYGLGWDALASDTLGGEPVSNLVDEALYLADLTASLLPGSAEACGLLALLLFSHARRTARLGAHGEFIPLALQDTARWDLPAVAQANRILHDAAVQGQTGPFQIEAAIQSAHCERHFTGRVPWPDIVRLYQQLLTLAPTTGARVGHAVALAESGAVAQGLDLLDALDGTLVASYQPYWVARSHLLALHGQYPGAAACCQRALGLTTQPGVRGYLQARLQMLQNK